MIWRECISHLLCILNSSPTVTTNFRYCFWILIPISTSLWNHHLLRTIIPTSTMPIMPLSFFFPLNLSFYLTEMSTSGPTEPGGLILHDKSSPMLKTQSEKQTKHCYITYSRRGYNCYIYIIMKLEKKILIEVQCHIHLVFIVYIQTCLPYNNI